MSRDKIKSNDFFKFYDDNLLNYLNSLIIEPIEGQEQIWWGDDNPTTIKHLSDTLSYVIYDAEVFAEINKPYKSTYNNYYILYSMLYCISKLVTHDKHKIFFYKLKINEKNILTHHDLEEFKNKDFIKINLFYKDSIISNFNENK